MKRTFKAMTMTYSAETVVMFPGQGAQYVGMGAELVKEVGGEGVPGGFNGRVVSGNERVLRRGE